MSDTPLIRAEFIQLLHALAQESREEPHELLERLLKKEHFERHFDWNALEGKATQKICVSMDCFMKNAETYVSTKVKP